MMLQKNISLKLILIASLILLSEVFLFHIFDSGKNESRIFFGYFGVFNYRHYRSPFDWAIYQQMLWFVSICLFVGLILGGWINIFSMMLSLGLLGNILQLHFFGYAGDWIGFFVSKDYIKIANLSDVLFFFGSILFCFSIIFRGLFFVFKKIKK